MMDNDITGFRAVSYFDEIISREDQYEVAKARASISFTVKVLNVFIRRLPEFIDARFTHSEAR